MPAYSSACSAINLNEDTDRQRGTYCLRNRRKLSKVVSKRNNWTMLWTKSNRSAVKKEKSEIKDIHADAVIMHISIVDLFEIGIAMWTYASYNLNNNYDNSNYRNCYSFHKCNDSITFA